MDDFFRMGCKTLPAKSMLFNGRRSFQRYFFGQQMAWRSSFFNCDAPSKVKKNSSADKCLYKFKNSQFSSKLTTKFIHNSRKIIKNPRYILTIHKVIRWNQELFSERGRCLSEDFAFALRVGPEFVFVEFWLHASATAAQPNRLQQPEVCTQSSNFM